MQTNCVRKTGAVFFGGREIIRGNLTRAALLKIMLRVLVLIKQHTLHAYIHFPHRFFY